MKMTQHKKRSLFRVSQSIVILLVLALAVGLVLFAKKYHRQWDWSETHSFTLSEQTVKVLYGLKEPVQITTFFKKDSEEKGKFKDLMTAYLYRTDKISVTDINPDQDSSLVKQYGVREYDTIYFELGDRHTQTTDVSEEAITNGLITLLGNKTPKIAVLAGDGERTIDSTEADGLSIMAQELGKAHYDVKSLNLLQTAAIPDDVDVLVIPTPTHALLPKEEAALETYLKKEGARALVLLDPAEPNAVRAQAFPFLDLFPVKATGEVVIDPVSRLFGGDYAVPIVTQYPPHAITRGLKASTFFPLAQPFVSESKDEETWQVYPLAETSPQAWGEKGSLKGRVAYDDGIDHKGPLTLAYALEKKAANSGKTTRIVMVGDGDFISNAYYDQAGNRDLFMNMIHWLASEENLIAIHPHAKVRGELLLTLNQGRLFLLVSVFVIPLVLLGIAIAMWRRRRRK